MPEGASVLFITSIAAFFPDDRSSLLMAMYGVSKTALLGVVKALSFELGLSGVRVNGLAAGVIPTGFSSILTGEKTKHLVVRSFTKSCMMWRGVQLRTSKTFAGAALYLAILGLMARFAIPTPQMETASASGPTAWLTGNSVHGR